MKKIFTFLLCFTLIFQNVNAAYVGNEYISSLGACVMDYETGELFYKYDGDTVRLPASMVKIMNMYCVYEALANNEISLNTAVPISKKVYNISRDCEYQSIILNYNTTYTVDEMMDSVVVYSALAGAMALAELVGNGSEAVFVERMNKKASEWGIDAYFYDSCGVCDNYISPVAMATIARNIIHDYPDILNRTSKKSLYFHGSTYNTTNHLLDTYYYEGADGLKTGTAPRAGFCFCGTAVKNGRRMIAVTMDSSSYNQRFIDVTKLFNYGFWKASEKFDNIYYTDIRTFINGNEIPTMMHYGKINHAVIVAENLSNYGFDVSYNENDKTLRIKYKNSGLVTPVNTESYKGKNGQKAMPIVCNSDVRVIFEDYELKDIYNIGGYMCVSVDELANVYYFEWNESEQLSDITAWEK